MGKKNHSIVFFSQAIGYLFIYFYDTYYLMYISSADNHSCV